MNAELTPREATPQIGFRLTASPGPRAGMAVTKRNGEREPVDVNRSCAP